MMEWGPALIFVTVYVVLMRWVLPYFGVTT